MYRFIYFFIVFLFFSCGTQKQLQKSYLGKPVSYLIENLGEPKTIIDRGQEKVYVFEQIKKLASTEVNQGKLALDPMITPKVSKTERYFFTVKDGKVIKTKIEEEYER